MDHNVPRSRLGFSNNSYTIYMCAVLLCGRKEVEGMGTEMEREMTVEGGVMAGVGTKDKCKMPT